MDVSKTEYTVSEGMEAQLVSHITEQGNHLISLPRKELFKMEYGLVLRYFFIDLVTKIRFLENILLG
jgi:hypothetical protein